MLNTKMIAVMSEVGKEVAERSDLIEKMAIALLTRKNLFILGDTGQAKSYAINLFRRRIEGAKQFERLLSKQTDEEQLFGRLDLGSLIPGNVSKGVLEQDAIYTQLIEKLAEAREEYSSEPNGIRINDALQNVAMHKKILAELHGNEPQVITTGKIPEAHIIFIDEVFKANDGILNALLTALNERKYTNEGYTTDIPAISFFAASNEIPNFSDPAESILRPLYDRFELKVVTRYVEDKQARLAMLHKKQQASTAAATATISLDELYSMQEEVRNISVPDSINELMDNILCELRRRGVHVSDRKYFGFTPLVQAKAWLSSRDEVKPCDLAVLCAYLWTTPEEIEKVQAVIREICENPLGESIKELHSVAAEAFSDFNSGANGNTSRAMVKFRNEFVALYKQIDALKNEAQSERDENALAELINQLEDMSRQAHATSGFTYARLSELSALQ